MLTLRINGREASAHYRLGGIYLKLYSRFKSPMPSRLYKGVVYISCGYHTNSEQSLKFSLPAQTILDCLSNIPPTLLTIQRPEMLMYRQHYI